MSTSDEEAIRCSWENCLKEGGLVGFSCFRPIFACNEHNPSFGHKPVGFRHHRLDRGVTMSLMAKATGWSPVRISEIDTGRYRMNKEELKHWWDSLMRTDPFAREEM